MPLSCVSKSLVQPDVILLSVCTPLLYVKLATHNSDACVVVEVVPVFGVVEVVAVPAVLPTAVTSTGEACQPFVALHSSMIM